MLVNMNYYLMTHVYCTYPQLELYRWKLPWQCARLEKHWHMIHNNKILIVFRPYEINLWGDLAKVMGMRAMTSRSIIIYCSGDLMLIRASQMTMAKKACTFYQNAMRVLNTYSWKNSTRSIADGDILTLVRK